MRIMVFGDIHFHHTHSFSTITSEGYTVRELEHLSCADTLIRLYKEKHIDKVVCLGDIYQAVGDNVSCQTQKAVLEFFDKLRKALTGKIQVLVGNHDWSSSVNNHFAHKLISLEYMDGIEVFDKPVVVGNEVFMPFMSNYEAASNFLSLIKDKEDKIIYSHLELKDINLGNGIFSKKGVSIDLLKQFKVTFQGHYHSGGNYGKNIYIAGSTQRLFFKDPGRSKKNILIYDTETGKVERESFDCPDWLTFTDDNIDDILKISDDNYVKVEVTSDILLTDKIKDKLEHVKGKTVHIDLTRISVNKKIENEAVTTDDSIEVVKQFVNKSDNTEEQKCALIQYGIKLIDRAS